MRILLWCIAVFFKGLGFGAWPTGWRGSPAYWLLWRVSLILINHPFLIKIPFKLVPFCFYSRKLLKLFPAFLFVSPGQSCSLSVVVLWRLQGFWSYWMEHLLQMCTTLLVWPGGCAMVNSLIKDHFSPVSKRTPNRTIGVWWNDEQRLKPSWLGKEYQECWWIYRRVWRTGTAS